MNNEENPKSQQEPNGTEQNGQVSSEQMITPDKPLEIPKKDENSNLNGKIES
jgi:hypothetical protein